MRSPAYPAIGLGAAIELTQKLWTAQKRSKVPLGTAVRNMGFKGPTGATGTRVSALRKYGLLDQSGGDVEISELGIKIVAPVRPVEQKTALREAAEKVDLFVELRGKYAGADEQTLHSVLTRDGFSDSGARQAIAAYRDTAAFAKWEEEPYNPDDGHDEDDDEDEDARLKRRDSHTRNKEKGMTVLSFQVSDRLVEVAVEGGPLTKGEIDTLKAYLGIQEKIAPAEEQRAGLTEAGARRFSVTEEAHDLVKGLGDESTPLYITPRLKRIAEENEIEVSDETTPNEVIDALREKIDGGSL